MLFLSSALSLTIHNKQLTNTRRSDGGPDPDAVFKEVVRIKIRHYRNLYLNYPDPIAFIPLTVDTTGRMYDEFIRLLFLDSHREASALSNELPEESDQFRFLHVSCFANLEGVVGLIMVKTSVIRISIPLDLSSRSCVPLPRFIRSCRPTPLLAPSLVIFPPHSAEVAHVECLFLAFHWLLYSSSCSLAVSLFATGLKKTRDKGKKMSC